MNTQETLLAKTKIFHCISRVTKRIALQNSDYMAFLISLPSDSSGQLHISRHNGDALCVNCAQVRVLKKGNQVSLCGFLDGQDCHSLHSQMNSVRMKDFFYSAREGCFPYEKVRAFLVLADFSQGC